MVVIASQDVRLIALQIFKLAFFRKHSYLILKILTVDPHFKICLSSQHKKEMTDFVLFCSVFKKRLFYKAKILKSHQNQWYAWMICLSICFNLLGLVTLQSFLEDSFHNLKGHSNLKQSDNCYSSDRVCTNPLPHCSLIHGFLWVPADRFDLSAVEKCCTSLQSSRLIPAWSILPRRLHDILQQVESNYRIIE